MFQPFTISGAFKSKFDIEDEDGNKYGKPYRTLESFTITNEGSGYKLGDRVFLNDKIVSTFFARVASVQDGKVKRLRITEYGSGNSQDSSITEILKDFARQNVSPQESAITDLDTNGTGTGLKVNLNFDILINEDGKYTDTKGRLSDDTVVQDSDFFQKFSYELSTDEEFSRYKSFYLDLLHPAGEKPFHNTRKTLPTQSNEVTNEEVTIKEVTVVDLDADVEAINIPQAVFLLKQDYFNIDSTEPSSPLGIDKPYIKEDYLVTSVKITE